MTHFQELETNGNLSTNKTNLFNNRNNNLKVKGKTDFFLKYRLRPIGGLYQTFSAFSYFRKMLDRVINLLISRSNPPKVFLEKGVLKICNKFTGELPCQSVISIKMLCFYY